MMKTFLVFLSLACGLSFCLPPSARAVEMGIALVVNDHMISDLDVRDRMKMIMSSSGIPNTSENRTRLRPQIEDMLMIEALKMEQADTLEIEVTPEQINEGIGRIARQNKMTPEQFERLLTAQGIPRRTIEDQVRAELAWGEFVRKELRPQVNITESDIDAELEMLKTNPKFAKNLPDREQVLNKIGMDRLGRLQRRYLMDLKAGAYIEDRG